MRERKIDGGTCARCKQPVGLVKINDSAVEVEPTSVIWDDVVVLKLHFCRTPPVDDLGVEQGQVVKNGRKVGGAR